MRWSSCFAAQLRPQILTFYLPTFNLTMELLRTSLRWSCFTLRGGTEPGDHVLCLIRRVASLCFLFEFARSSKLQSERVQFVGCGGLTIICFYFLRVAAYTCSFMVHSRHTPTRLKSSSCR